MIPRLPHGFSHPMLIGEGGFSSVYRVRQIALDRWAAIKIVHEDDPKKRRGLLREAKTLAGIKAACIPKIYDTFEKRGLIYMIMEWIQGVSLSAMLESKYGRELDARQRIWIADGFIKALAQLHSFGIAHRDIKPSNIIISPENCVYLVDFGLSKRITVEDNDKTLTGIVKGTPAYMAPELWRKDVSVDYPCADVYAAGKVLMQLLPYNLSERITPALLADDPSLRVKDGSGILDRWNAVLGDNRPQPCSENTASLLNNLLLSNRLFASAKELMYNSREQEAYWLLVECLEHNPDHGDAISMMNRFPETLHQRRIRRILSGALTISVILLVVCISLLFFGSSIKLALSTTQIRDNTDLKNIKMEMRKPFRKSAIIVGAFRQTAPSTGTLCGIVQFTKVPSGANLIIDGISQPDTLDAFNGIALAPGVHSMILLNRDGSLIWKEHVRLLPFQTRRISITQMR